MFLHIGNGVSVVKKQVVAILDIDSAPAALGMKEYMRFMQQKGLVKTVGCELPKSVVITQAKGEQICHVSPISVWTLKQRFNEKGLEHWKRS